MAKWLLNEIERACREDDLAKIKYYIEQSIIKPDKNLVTGSLLTIAAQSGSAKVVEYLIGAGANVDAMDFESRRPLVEAVLGNHEKCVELLLQAGADPCAWVDDPDEDNAIASAVTLSARSTLVIRDMVQAYARPFHVLNVAKYDSEDGHIEHFQSLVSEHAAHVNKTDVLGKTALCYAVYDNKMAFVRILLEKGANPNLCDTQGVTPLMHAQSKQMVDILVDAGARAYDKNARGKSVAACVSVLAGQDVARYVEQIAIDQISSLASQTNQKTPLLPKMRRLK